MWRHVDDLAALSNKTAWSIHLRRSLLPLPASDTHLLTEELLPLTQPLHRGKQGYLRWLPAQ